MKPAMRFALMAGVALPFIAVAAYCGLGLRSLGTVSVGDRWALDISNRESWARAVWSVLIGTAVLAGAMGLLLPRRLFLWSWTLFCVGLFIGAIAAHRSPAPSTYRAIMVSGRSPIVQPDPEALFFERAATAGLAGLAFMAAIGIAGLIVAMLAGFSWGRTAQCFLAVLFGAGVIAVPGAFGFFFVGIGVGLAQGQGHEWLDIVGLIVASTSALGALLALWLVERTASPPREWRWLAGAFFGFVAGTAACCFVGVVLPLNLDLGMGTFLSLSPLTIAATTVGGYARSVAKSGTRGAPNPLSPAPRHGGSIFTGA
jgi:hypothetical protein